MTRSLIEYLKKNVIFSGVIVLLLATAITFSLRKPDFRTGAGIQNLNATYHVLLTIRALKSSPAENHWFLPTVSLQRERDKNIPWGATLPTKSGDHVYTSFTPPGFIVPYVVFAAFKLEETPENLARFNLFIGLAVSLLLYRFLVAMLERGEYSRPIAVGGALVGVVISVASKEVLQSHGLVYWSQSLYQAILALTLYFLVCYLSDQPESIGQKKRSGVYLIAAVFFGAWTEWAGYIFGMGLALLLWFGLFCDRPHRALAAKLVLALMAAGALTFIHFGLAVGFKNSALAFLARFLARGANAGSLQGLLSSYVLSYGMFVLVIVFSLLLPFFSPNKRALEPSPFPRTLAFMFLAAAIPLFENLILMQHAEQYSYDRLKFIFPASIIIAVGFARFSTIGRIWVAVLTIVASFQGFYGYKKDMLSYVAWQEKDARNQLLASVISKSVDKECAVFLSNIGVRGYANLLFDSGIYEYKNESESIPIMNKVGACAVIYLDGVWSLAYSDLPYYRRALITKANGDAVLIESIAEESIDESFFLSDNNWEHGVARGRAGFFVPNTEKVRARLVKGTEVILNNGEVRKVAEVTINGQYLNVFVDGSLIDAAHIGSPSSYLMRYDVSHQASLIQ